MARDDDLSLHDRALAVIASTIKEAQETALRLHDVGSLTREQLKNGTAVRELLVLFITLWAWFEPNDPDKLKFFDSLLFWARDWLLDNQGANMSKKGADAFFELLHDRSLEYVRVQNQYRSRDDFLFILGSRILSNITGIEADDPLPITVLLDGVKAYTKLIDASWKIIKSRS